MCDLNWDKKTPATERIFLQCFPNFTKLRRQGSLNEFYFSVGYYVSPDEYHTRFDIYRDVSGKNVAKNWNNLLYLKQSIGSFTK